MSSKEQYRSYVSDLKNKIRKTNEIIEKQKKIIEELNADITIFREVITNKNLEIKSLQERLRKAKRWYQILI